MLTAFDGPIYGYGRLAKILASVFGSAVDDPNSDAGPSAAWQGYGVFDPRFLYLKDQLQGYRGKQPIHYAQPYLRSVSQIPAATANNNIAAGQNVVSGTPMTLAGASTGITLAVPINTFNPGSIAGGAVVSAMALDFGFAFGNCTANNTTIVVADSTKFLVGMPLVIGGVGNAGGTIPLLTNVASITDGTHIVLFNAPLATNATAPIGTGNIWGPSETWSGSNITPTAALPWLSGGPGLFLDGRQAVARGVRVVGVGGSTGGTILVSGYDVYGVAMSELITVAAGVATGWGVKAFKYITSAVPKFTDAHAYSVGTSDVFGIHYWSPLWEDLEVCWATLTMTANTGFTAGLALTSTSTTTTADVRGTILVSGNGSGSGIGATASNGTVASLAMSGNRLMIEQAIPADTALFADIGSYASLFGIAQL